MRRVPTTCIALGVTACLASCSLRPGPATGDRTGQGASAEHRATARTPRPPIASDPVLHDWALYETIRASARMGDVAGAESARAQLEASYPGSIWTGRARLAVGLAFQRTDAHADALAWLRRAADALEDDIPHRGRAQLGVAESAAALARSSVALAAAGHVRRALPRTLAGRRARRLVDRLIRRDPALLESPQARLDEAELRLAEGMPESALAMISDASRWPTPARHEAAWIEARAARALGRDDDATRLARALATQAAPALAATALHDAARWRWNADDDARAAEIFAEVVRRFPSSPEAARAGYALARIHQTAGRFDAAVAAFDRVPATAPLAVEAAWGAAWSRVLAGRWDDAAERFATLRARGGAMELAATYWSGRARAELGDPAGITTLRRLAEWHGDDYYGHMAARHLGQPTLPPQSTAVLVPARPPFPETLTDIHADRARAFAALGRANLARRELDTLRGIAPAALLAQAYEAVGAPGPALQLAADASGRDDRRPWRLHPLGYWETVRVHAAAHGLDPLLVLALIRQESAFRPDAISSADAHGLMQLLPRTAAGVAGEIGLPPPDRWALHGVALNVALGTRLLASLLDEYDGSHVRALAAYNAGREAVAKWQARHGTRPDDEFVELVSYRETRRYVKRVLANYMRYRRLYAPTAPAMSFGSPPNAPLDMITITSPG